MSIQYKRAISKAKSGGTAAVKAVKSRIKKQPDLKKVTGLTSEPERKPVSGYPVIVRREVAPNITQVTTDKYRWYVFKQTKKEFHVVPSVTYVTDSVLAKGKGYNDWLSQHSFEEAASILHEAGDRGTRIHAAICHAILHGRLDFNENYSFLEGRPFSAREYVQLKSFAAFWKMLKPKALKIEQPVVNIELGYGGTTDFLGVVDEGALLSFNARKKDNGVEFNGEATTILWDWKSGNNLYDSHKLQVAAYANELKPKYYGLVQLGTKNGNGFKLWFARRDDPAEPHFDAFKHCLSLFNIYHGKERPEIINMEAEINLGDEMPGIVDDTYENESVETKTSLVQAQQTNLDI